MSDTHTPVPGPAVLAACDRYLQRREERIERESEALILQQMGRRRLWRPNMTRDEAVNYLQNGESPFSSWWDIRNRGEFWSDKVRALRQIARVAVWTGEPVFLSTEHASALQKDLPPPEET